jgi:CRP-like cAMP-binding protein
MLHAELLAQIPLFDTLASEDLDALAGRMTERTFKQGEIVFKQGDKGSSMYVVLSGAVQIFLPGGGPEDPRVILKDARTGEYFGELSLFDDKPRSASVEATVDTVLLELTRDAFGDHLSRSKNAAMTILAEMAERLRETNALLSQRAAKDVVKEIEENLTWGQRLADRVAALNGSWAFIIFILLLTTCWIGVNRIIDKPFDQYPFEFYALALALIIAMQGPLR